MANEFVTPQQIADAASVYIESRLVTAGALDHNTENMFGRGTGKSVTVRTAASLQPAGDLNKDGTAKTDDLNETSTEVILEKHFYKQVALSATDRTLNIADLTKQVVAPMIDSLVMSIETYANAKLAANAGGKTGTGYAAPTTLADCARANRWFTDKKIVPQGRYAFIGAETEEALLQLEAFTSGDYGKDGPQALRDAILGRRMGMDFVVNPYATEVAAIPGTLTVKEEANPGSKTINIAGITAGTYVPAGAALTINGTQYFVAEEIAAAVADKQPVKLSVGLKAKAAAGASVTSNAYTQSFIAHKSCAAIAIVAPEASSGAQSAVAQYRGISVRVTSDFDGSKLGDTLTIDVLVGMKVIRPEACALFTAK